MFIYLARLIVIIAGPIIGYMKISPDGKGILIGTAAGVLVIAVEIIIQKIRLDDMIFGGLGLILGLVTAYFINRVLPALMDNPAVTEIFTKYSLLVSVVLGYIGMIIALTKKGELDLLDKELRLSRIKPSEGIKVLDSSAIIDGRLIDIVETGFLSGVLLIPEFIMGEVQATADSPDEEKRQRARRALDIVNDLRENKKVVIKIYDKNYPNIEQVDAKLIKICQELKSKLITCDYNLTKSGQAQGIQILNVNELASVLKPKLLPGEAMEIFILKKGKDKGQGIGYTEDGMMVIVDGGISHIGKKVEVTVTSVLQKASGRIVFARVS
jgi:uncharacterized protein YacL